MNITWKGSPNYDKGRAGTKIDRIVIHWFGLGTLEAANSRFQNPSTKVSAHYGVSKGRVWQWVKEEDIAWGAGVYAMNKRCISIEHDAGIDPKHDLSDEDYQLSGQLVADICKRHDIPLDRVHIIKHNEVKATQCPGTVDPDRIIKIANQILNPTPMYPIIFKIKLLVNHANWPSLQRQIDQACAWYKEKSGNKINLKFDVELTDFTGIPFSDYDGSEFFAWGVEKNWQLVHILPKAKGYDMVVFQMQNADWDTSQHGQTQAVMLGDLAEPTKLQFINSHSDEMDNINLVMFGDHFSYLLCHEISHAILALTGQDFNGVALQNGNVTHQLFYTENFKDAPKIFDVINYQALTNVLALRRGPQGETMDKTVVFAKRGTPLVAILQEENWQGFADTESYNKHVAGTEVVTINLDPAEFDKLVIKDVIKK